MESYDPPSVLRNSPNYVSDAGRPRFAIIGAAGFIAPKHLKAIKDIGGVLVAAVDPHDSVGILDSYFPDCHFFTEIERFDRFLEKQRRGSAPQPIQYISICSPNYLHDAHVRLALRVGAHAICEKPLVINPWNLDQLEALEQEYGRKVYTVLQLRYHPAVKALKERLKANPKGRSDVCLTYVTRRGRWYHYSWKGKEEKSGGLVMNIGVHFFDLLLWLFGRPERSVVHHQSKTRAAGFLSLERADVRWFLSIESRDIPSRIRRLGGYAYRSITVDGAELDLSSGFGDLHTVVYREILSGRGLGIQEARPSIELVYNIRHARESNLEGFAHPLLASLALS